jgi:hypothetical protein
MTALVPYEARDAAFREEDDDSELEVDQEWDDLELLEAAERYSALATDDASQAALTSKASGEIMWQIAASQAQQEAVSGWGGASLGDGGTSMEDAGSRSLLGTSSFRSDSSLASGSWDWASALSGHDADSDHDSAEAREFVLDEDLIPSADHVEVAGAAGPPTSQAPRLAVAPARRHSHAGVAGELATVASASEGHAALSAEPARRSFIASPVLGPAVTSSASSARSSASARSSGARGSLSRRRTTTKTGWHAVWASDFPAWSDAACADALIGMIRGATPGFIAYRALPTPSPCLSLSLATARPVSAGGIAPVTAQAMASWQAGGIAMSKACCRRIIGAATASAIRMKDLRQVQHISDSGMPPTEVMCGELPTMLIMGAALAAYTAKDSLFQAKVPELPQASKLSKRKVSSLAAGDASNRTMSVSGPSSALASVPVTRSRTSSLTSGRPAGLSIGAPRTAPGEPSSLRAVRSATRDVADRRQQAAAVAVAAAAAAESASARLQASEQDARVVSASSLFDLFTEQSDEELRRARALIGKAPTRLGFSLSEAAVDAISAAIEARLLRILRGAMWVAVHQYGTAHGCKTVDPASVVVTPAAVELAALMTSRTAKDNEIGVPFVSPSHSLLL